ncbi:MAG: hypothetical protein ACOX0X_02270 [Candidatus Dojkabacteria bacterium]|jgi:uncharacterized membrane protein YeaQ/YmgE (transglycosylase-associated protein family)
MSDMLGLIIMITTTVVGATVVGAIVYIIVQSIKAKESSKAGEFKVTTRLLFQTYLYLILFLSMIIGIVGATIAIRAALSYKFDVPFSYSLYQAEVFEDAKLYDPTLKPEEFKECHTGEPVVYKGSTYCFDTEIQKTDLINGITVFVSMVILFAMHQFALSRIKSKDRYLWLNKVYLFVSLIVYSVIGLITIPIATYQLTNYILSTNKEILSSTPEAPALALALVALTIPLWILFLKRTATLKEK